MSQNQSSHRLKWLASIALLVLFTLIFFRHIDTPPPFYWLPGDEDPFDYVAIDTSTVNGQTMCIVLPYEVFEQRLHIMPRDFTVIKPSSVANEEVIRPGHVLHTLHLQDCSVLMPAGSMLRFFQADTARIAWFIQIDRDTTFMQATALLKQLKEQFAQATFLATKASSP